MSGNDHCKLVRQAGHKCTCSYDFIGIVSSSTVEFLGSHDAKKHQDGVGNVKKEAKKHNAHGPHEHVDVSEETGKRECLGNEGHTPEGDGTVVADHVG